MSQIYYDIMDWHINYIPLEKGDYCPLCGRCVGEDCEYGHWKDGCLIYNKTEGIETRWRKRDETDEV